jgi:DNA-binding transcriptional ArsR family regulator
MLELLREGPSTASRLARAIGESTGATSYHLRALAKAGVVEEEVGRGNGRERWWRRRANLIVIPTGSDDPDLRAAENRMRGVFLERDEDAMRRFLAQEEALEPGLRRASFVGGWHAWGTPEEIEALGHRVMALVDELRRPEEERPEGARRIYVTFRAIPWLERE